MNVLSNLNAARILVAESQPDDMDHTARLLENAGYNVYKAYYAADALAALNEHRFDLALIDAGMTDAEQRLLAAHMHRYAPMRWVALVDDHTEDPGRLLRQGAALYIRRPPEPGILLRQVEEVLNGTASTPAPAAGSPRRDDEMRAMLERRLVEQQTLSALARMLSAVLDLDTLLTQVVDAAVRLSNAEEGLLLLPAEDGKTLYVRAAKGIDQETSRNFRVKTKDTLAGQVFQFGQPVVVGDQGWQKIKTEYLVKSLLYVPLSLKGEIIGVLGVNNKQSTRTFSRHDSELLQDLAAHAAIAIENARLYEDSVLRTRELSLLVQAGEAANSTLDLNAVLSTIADQVMAILNVTQCYIAEWTPEQPELRLLAARSRALWRPGEGYAFAPGDIPAVEQAFSQKQPIWVEPPAPLADPATAWLPQRYQAASVIYLPLSTADQPLGLVTLSYLSAPALAQADLQAARLPLQQLALDMLVALAEPEALRQQKTLFRQIQRMLETAHADWCEVALWNPIQRRLNTLMSYGEVIRHEGPVSVLPLEAYPSLDRALREQVAFTGTLADGGDLCQLVAAGHGKSWLGLPLIRAGQTAGLVLLADTLYQRHFSAREIKLAQALVLQAANALSNARLYRDLQISLDELHRAQIRLVQNARLSAMGELAAVVAHQINNPLTTVLGDTELVLRDLPPDDPNAESLAAVFRAGKRAHEVVRRLLAMARPSLPDDQPVLIDVNETITNTLTLVRHHITHGNVALHIELEDDMPPVAVFQNQLEDVWMNLLLNARDALAGRAQAEIGIASAYDPVHRQVMVSIWDNGKGIPDDALDRVFEPFFTTKPAGQGTGLGLHICRQIIEKCGGTIRVESVYNQGTRFTIHLPIDDQPRV
jgi:signal transduction histidine kinase/DNA-binding response OmpR family regulator